MKKKLNSQLLAIVGLAALGVLIGIAGLMLAVLPQQSQAQKLDREIAATQQKLAMLQASHGPVIKAADLFQLARAMPDQQDMPDLVINLAGVANAASVGLVSMTPSAAVVQTDGSQAIPLRLTVNGTWSGITTFLRLLRMQVQVQGRGQRLHATGRLFVVDSVGLAGTAGPSAATPPPPGAPKAPEVVATIGVNAFTYGTAVPTATGTTSTDTTATTTTSSGVAAAPAPTGSAG